MHWYLLLLLYCIFHLLLYLLLYLRYTEVISDGDSKSIAHLREVKPYGDGVEILKHECISHLAKRVGKNFRAEKKVKKIAIYFHTVMLFINF